MVPALIFIYELLKIKVYLAHFPFMADSTSVRGVYLALGQLFTAVLGVLSGFELPLLIRLVTRLMATMQQAHQAQRAL